MGVIWGLDLYHTLARRLFEVSELLYKINIDSYTPIEQEGRDCSGSVNFALTVLSMCWKEECGVICN